MKNLNYNYPADGNITVIAALIFAILAGFFGIKELVKFLLQKFYEVLIQHQL